MFEAFEAGNHKIKNSTDFHDNKQMTWPELLERFVWSMYEFFTNCSKVALHLSIVFCWPSVINLREYTIDKVKINYIGNNPKQLCVNETNYIFYCLQSGWLFRNSCKFCMVHDIWPPPPHPAQPSLYTATCISQASIWICCYIMYIGKGIGRF